jgi:nitroreductase
MINEILEAARLAPSGSNRQPWRFLVVTDIEDRAKLRKICWDQAFIEQRYGSEVTRIGATNLTDLSNAVKNAKALANALMEHGFTLVSEKQFTSRVIIIR